MFVWNGSAAHRSHRERSENWLCNRWWELRDISAYVFHVCYYLFTQWMCVSWWCSGCATMKFNSIVMRAHTGKRRLKTMPTRRETLALRLEEARWLHHLQICIYTTSKYTWRVEKMHSPTHKYTTFTSCTVRPRDLCSTQQLVNGWIYEWISHLCILRYDFLLSISVERLRKVIGHGMRPWTSDMNESQIPKYTIFT